MGDIVSSIFTSFTTVITNLTTGLKDAFTNIIYEDPAATEKVLSAPVQFGLIFAGIALASGLVMGIFAFIKSKRA